MPLQLTGHLLWSAAATAMNHQSEMDMRSKRYMPQTHQVLYSAPQWWLRKCAVIDCLQHRKSAAMPPRAPCMVQDDANHHHEEHDGQTIHNCVSRLDGHEQHLAHIPGSEQSAGQHQRPEWLRTNRARTSKTLPDTRPSESDSWTHSGVLQTSRHDSICHTRNQSRSSWQPVGAQLGPLRGHPQPQHHPQSTLARALPCRRRVRPPVSRASHSCPRCAHCCHR